jgi:hypothetical protein
MDDKDNIESLLKVVGLVEGLPEESKATDPGVFNFILNNGIKEGVYNIPQAKIYSLYTNTVANPLPVKLFFKEFRKYFKQMRTNSVRYYKLNRKPFGLPEGFSIYKTSSGFQKKQKKYKKVKDGIQETQQAQKEEA